MPVQLTRKSAELTSTQVERHYRSQILSGKILEGTKLPTNQQLAREWSSSTMAIQRALATLAAEGLLERRQRRGTFVRPSTQQAYIGILIGSDLIEGSSTFYRLLCTALRDRLDSQYIKTRVYDNLTFAGKNSSHSHGNFMADRKTYPFKGYILIGTSNVTTRQLRSDITPRAVLQDCTRGQDVLLDYGRFVGDSIRALVARGYRRITYFRGVQSSPIDQIHLPVAGLDETAQTLRIPKPKVLSVRITGDHSTYEKEIDQGISKIFDEHLDFKRHLPDAFLVQDDVSARPLIVNLLKRGVRIPDDVAICTQATTGNNIYYGVPTFRYEFSMPEIASQLCDILGRRLRRQTVTDVPRIISGQFLA